MLIVMAGLPGAGKSTLAARLATRLNGVVLSKDIVRAALFPTRTIDYTSAQDEIAMHAVYAAAEYTLRTVPACPVFIDGRTFSKAGQIDVPLALAASLSVVGKVIECVCDAEVARSRIAHDESTGAHLAQNRTPELHTRAAANAVPLAVSRLVVDTGTLTIDECERLCCEYLVRR